LAQEKIPPVDKLMAANCLVRHGRFEPFLVAHNSDVAGFVEPLRELDFSGADWLFAHVIGTGGAAAAVTHALHDLGVTVFNYGRTSEQAEALRRRLGEKDMDFALDWADLAAGGSLGNETEESVIELIVNATPMGMNGFPPLELSFANWSHHTIVYDLVYEPLETPLLAAARQRGLRTINGLEMLIGQAAAAFELFFEAAAPREHDAELRELLTRC
jgi:shikimate dehydrogenase